MQTISVPSPSAYSDTTHGRFIEHMDLARAWCQWNGQKGTEQQLSRLMGRLDAATLRRMLAARGVTETH
jgi:hypothetical protein